MSSRLHNKYHRHNHHTVNIEDPRYPDASHDPIASPESPFLGDFVLNGTLSAIPFNEGEPAIVAEGDVDIFGTLFVGASAEVIGSLTVSESLSTGSDITTDGNLTVSGSIINGSDISSGGNLTLNGSITATSITLIDSGDLLLTGALTATNIALTNANIETYYTPLTASGEFLVLNINGVKRALRLWKEM